jgi:subtilisin family serine protease
MAPSPGSEPSPDAQAEPSPVAAPDRGPGERTITLVTGDVVRFAPGKGQPSVDVTPAPRSDGREVSFHSFPVDNGFVVLPEDAIGLVAAGTLDQDLFNPQVLAQEGAGADGTIPLLIEDPGTAARALGREANRLPGSEEIRILESIDAAAIEVQPAKASHFWAGLTAADGLVPAPENLSAERVVPDATNSDDPKIWLDRKVTATLDESAAQVGAPTAWDLGLDGEGATAAVLDTGIDPEHPDFVGRIAQSADFTGKGSAVDGHGHGTHVAGIVAGDGAASDGKYSGVAPGAELLVGKVLDDTGSGLTSWIIDGMEWAVAQDPDVVNMSLGARGGPTDGSDPLSRALDTLAESTDTLFVVAAGNAGAPLTVWGPASATQALTVGAVDDDDVLASFSSSGPRGGDGAVKPNLVAPGVSIVSARASGTDGPEPIDPYYTASSGTSMAAPHVAGAAALLAQQHPDWDDDDIRNALASTATPTDAIWYSQGAGRLDVASVVTSEVFASASVDFGALSRKGKPATEEVTFTNTGDDRITLELSIDGFSGWSGAPGPSHAVKLGAKKVTIPPAATRSVSLRVDPKRGEPGSYGGHVVAASADGTTGLTTAFSYYTGGDSHLVEFTGVHADGSTENPFNLSVVVLASLNPPTSPEDPFQFESTFIALDPAGYGALELAEGDYQVIGLIGDLRRGSGDIVLERLSVTSPQSVNLNASATVPVTPQVPERIDPRGQNSVLLVDVNGEDDPFWLRTNRPVSDSSSIAVTPQTGGGFRFAAQTNAEPAAVTRMVSGGRTYHPSYDVESVRRLLGDGGTWDVVSVGRGDPADYDGLDVTGKYVVIGVPANPDSPAPLHEAYFDLYPRAGLAMSKGARGVLAYLDEGDHPGGWVWPFGGIPVLGLSAAEGRQLASAASDGPVPLSIEGDASPDTAYRLRADFDGELPQSPATFGYDDLVRVDSSYHSDGTSITTTDTWATVTTDGWETLAPPESSVTVPFKRTEYVGATRDDLTWLRQVQQGSLTMRSARTYGPSDRGTRQDEHWFRAPLVPGAMTQPTITALPPGFPIPPPWLPGQAPCSLCRDGDRLVPALSWLDADLLHGGDLTPHVELFRAGTPIPVADGTPVSFVVPGDTAGYRLVSTDSIDGRRLPQSVTTETEFVSAPPSGRPEGFACTFGVACQFQPAPQLRYDVPLDLQNRAPAEAEFGFTVIGQTAAGQPVGELSVEYSTDGGASWTAASVSAVGGGRFAVTVEHPAVAATDGYVALRTSATDAAGGRVDQTILRAYALK